LVFFPTHLVEFHLATDKWNSDIKMKKRKKNNDEIYLNDLVMKKKFEIQPSL
jgi:hypothetical protein